MTMNSVVPCLWFDTQAEEAARFYVSIFDNSSIGEISRYGKEGKDIHGKAEGTVLTVAFKLRGVELTALNGGPEFTFSEAISLQVDCADQAEIDRYWKALGEGGTPGPCGWIKDKFGLSWQVYPRRLTELLADKDKAKAGRVMTAMLKMGKIVVADLEEAARGKAAA